MTRKEKYQDIDLSKLPEKAVEQLNKVKPYLFEDKYDKPENKEVKDKAEAAMDNLYKIISEKYPESIKSKVAKAPEPKTPQAKAKQIAQQTIVQPKKGQTTAKAKPSKRGNVGAVAKQIRKDGERWQDALKRAAQMINDEQKKAVTNANKQYKKLSAFLKKHPIPAGSTTIEIDAARKALPIGKRTAKKTGATYYEYRENRIDRTRKRYPYLELGGKIGKYAKGGETSRGNGLASVKVIFANPKYNYVSSINGSVTEKEARKYFVGKMLDVGTYPTEDMQKVIDIEFNSKGHFAKGGETDKKKVEIDGFRKNIMGTLSFNLRLANMRKPQDFVVYPASEATDSIMIQSDTRIGKIQMSNGSGKMSQSHPSGAYGVHLSMDKLIDFELSQGQLDTLKSELAKTAGSKVGKSVVFSDNSYADKYAKGGKVGDGRIKTIKESDIQVGRKFNLANGDTMKIVRLFKGNIDEDWAEYTYRGKNGEGSVNYLKNFINTWRGTVPHEFKKGGRIGKDWQGRKNKESWGKQDLSEQYDNNIDLIADVHDYYKAIAEQSGKDYSDNLKKQMIDALNTGVTSYSDGATLKFAKGGEVGVDLFEDYENIPAEVQAVLDQYSEGIEDGDYEQLRAANESLEKIGYTFDYYLDGVAYDLRPIGAKGKSEYAKGGETSSIKIGSEVLVHFRKEVGTVLGYDGDFIIVEYPNLGFSEKINTEIELVTLHNGHHAKGGLINLKGNVPAKPYPVIDTEVPVIK
jgi:hypothetical protein